MNYVQLRAGFLRNVCRRTRRERGVLGSIRRQKDLCREHIHILSLSEAYGQMAFDG